MMDERAPRVLVVEDARNWRRTLEALLEDAGCQVCSAASFQEGLSALDQGPFQLAIVDVRLVEGDESDTSGLHLVKEAWSRRSVGRFIVLSGYSTAELVRTELGAGVPNEILDKADMHSKQFKAVLMQLLNEASTDEPRQQA